jgi:hypothetical protein
MQGRSVVASPLPAPLLAIDFTLSPVTSTFTLAQGTTSTTQAYTIDNNNTGFPRTLRISIPEIDSNQVPGVTYTIFPNNPVTVPINSTINFVVRFTATSTAQVGTYALTLRATDPGNGEATSAAITLSVTPPPTATSTPATPTLTPTPVVTPVGCPEAADPGNDQGSAYLLRVDVAEKHGICDIGDVDWYQFGAIGNKVYTIDIPQMDAGLDLSLDLFDADGNRLTSNDDFNFRNQAQPDAKDIKPQIHSWRAPYDGLFYIQVRDTLNIGGGNRAYTIIINSESYGPTPVQITEICRDLFEEDGLPEQARLITSNELQQRHVLCPTGDADWVRFFGLRGKTYFIYTDTRPYRNNPQTNGDTEAGADTVIYLADRDGVSIIDFNDDIEGGSTLDSQLKFVPSTDGFYYAQIKNVGDIGNQYIEYDLTLTLCVSGSEECGRPTQAPARPSATATTGQGTPTNTPVDFLDDTPTPTPTETPTLESGGTFSQSSLKPGPMVNGPLRGFADPSFDRVWQRNDRPIAERRAARSWTWGPHGLMARTEGYIQAPSGLRQVQYFDKARMEVNNARGDRNSKWFVTTGLLVIELITGRTQIGENEFVQHAAADIPIAGDPGDPNAPTYASFGGVTGLQPGDRTGQDAAETLDRAGQVGQYAGPQRPEARLAHFVAESGHNVPQVFWDYLNSSGTVFDNQRYRNDTLVDWVFTLGYPLSEPYWTRIKVGGVDRDVLVQAFQRRVLTYSPDNPSGWQVEMGNVGRHYYFWRYGEELPG